MRLNIRTGTSIAFTFLALVVVSQAIVFWLPFWKETTVFRYHPKKGWHAIKHGGSSLWKHKSPLRLPPHLYRHRHNHHHHHSSPPFHHNPFRHFHPHRPFHLHRPFFKSPVRVLQKFKHWRPGRAHPHRHHLLHKPLCPTCHLTSWKPRKKLYPNNWFDSPFNQQPFSTIHHDFPKFGPFMFHNPTHVIPKMGPIFTKIKNHHLPNVKSVLRIKKIKKQKNNDPHHSFSKLNDFPRHDPFGKINAFQNTSPYPVRSNFPKSSPFPKNYIPKSVPFPKTNPFLQSQYSKYNHHQHPLRSSIYSRPSLYPSTSQSPPRINPYLSSHNGHSKTKSNANPFAEIENSPPLFSSQFSLGDSDSNFNKNYPFSQVAHFPKLKHHQHHHHAQYNDHPQEAPPFPKGFGTFGKDMALSEFASGKPGSGWGGWDW